MRYWGRSSRAQLMISAAAGALALSAGAAFAGEDAKINIAPQNLTSALYEFGVQADRQVMFTPDVTAAKSTQGVVANGDMKLALAQLLKGTGLTYRVEGDVFVIVQAGKGASVPQSGSAAGDGADAGTVQALIVTAQKREENIQDVPIAMSAFTQEDLTRSQVAGGPDLMTQVPNFTFTKTNFTGYSIQIRGIGTQAISATTDAAVAVAFNNTPFIRNHFFEQEFYDLERVEVLRGPQGTLYGRNATAGVVNVLSAKPSFRYEAKASADIGNYSSHRLEGMINLPLLQDMVALRVAGGWTKRDGYDVNQLTGGRIDGRNLWSTRVSLRVEPTDNLKADFIYEHFQEDDDRLRSGKQLCDKDPNPAEYNGVPIPPGDMIGGTFGELSYTTQGCRAASLYAPESFQTPNGYGLPYYGPLSNIGAPVFPTDPYASATQSPDLRTIESILKPEYKANADVVELQLSGEIASGFTLTSETAFNHDRIFSFEDFNRFNTKPGAFGPNSPRPGVVSPGGVFCDPQLGCSDRLVAGDLATATSHQFSQEFRLSSDLEGPFNFNLGVNFLRYDTEDKYYVFANSLGALAAFNAFSQVKSPYVPGVTDNTDCLLTLKEANPNISYSVEGCIYMDPNGIHNLNDLGHNYFLSRNPYRLLSYAAFGEAYYQVSPSVKLTAGLRWTVDRKHAPQIPSWVAAANSYGYPVRKVIDQEWREPTGRLALDWKPDLSFTDETLIYFSAAHGYKAGGSNPPPSILTGAVALNTPEVAPMLRESLSHPETFKPEFVNAFETGAKNTLLNGALTLNTTLFYYDYKGYQISQIVDRAAVNLNFDANVWGAEIEADWRPLENLRLGFKGGYENTRLAKGSRAIDLMDRTAGHTDWAVIKPFPTNPSNCILPVSYLGWVASHDGLGGVLATHGVDGLGSCLTAYKLGLDPMTGQAYTPYPFANSGGPDADYPGFDPAIAPNNGEGFSKDLSGNSLPNAPRFTTTLTADYTLPLPSDWLMTLHTDLYYQSEEWTRVFNTPGYDKLKAYTNINLAAIFSNEDAGWKIMAYVKNVMDRDSITGAFLNSDDTGLTTNVFLTEPRLYGLRVTKEWSGGPWWTGANPSHTGPWPLTVEIGGQAQRHDAPNEPMFPDIESHFPAKADPFVAQNERLDWGDGREVRLTYRSGGIWSAYAGMRSGKTNGTSGGERRESLGKVCLLGPEAAPLIPDYCGPGKYANVSNYGTSRVQDGEEHLIADFGVGRDVGLGLLGAKSTVTLGLRYARLKSGTSLTMWGNPDWQVPPDWLGVKYSQHHHYTASFDADRSFTGAGPDLNWDVSRPIWGDEQRGHLDVEGLFGGGVLFGKQKASVHHKQTAQGFNSKYNTGNYYPLTTGTVDVVEPPRRKLASVPVLDLNLGLSYSVQRVKIGAGYRWERYFDAIDGGVADRKTYDRTIDGPYFKIAVGFGG